MRALNPAVPPALAALVMKLLAKEPAQRPPSANAVADALAAMEEDKTQLLESVPQPGAQKPGFSKKPGFLGFLKLLMRVYRIPGRLGWFIKGATALVMLGFLIYFLLPPTGQRPLPETKSALLPEPEKFFTNSIGTEMVLVTKGSFLMGGGSGSKGTKEVAIPEDFYLGKYELTQGEWEKVMARQNPSYFSLTGGGKNDVAKIAADELKKFPVEQVSWNDAQDFLTRLNALEKKAGWKYRLPKEAEWEYACRGGSLPLDERLEYGFDFYFNKPTNTLLADMANFNSILKRTCKVGSYQSNRLGLYDMHGNVWEWCDDEIPGDPKDPKAASRRVNRGGCWFNNSGVCQAAARNVDAPSSRGNHCFGLRLARVPVGTGGK